MDLFGDADIIVNGTFQDPNQPLMFVNQDDIPRMKRGCLIIDVSCDAGMGFSFAQPTSFEKPMLKFDTLDYYAVDHTPTYLWESASRSISGALIVHLPTVVEGHAAWQQSETIRRAIVIDQGVILNPEVLAFQKREAVYPHASLTA
jgi:alanine dehydrogenase